MPREGIDCSDPNALLSTIPCLQCLPISSLRKIEMIFLAYWVYYDMPDDLDELIKDSACWRCLSKKQQLEAQLVAMGYWMFFEEPAPEEWLEMIKCVQCMDPAQVDAALGYLRCLFWDWD